MDKILNISHKIGSSYSNKTPLFFYQLFIAGDGYEKMTSLLSAKELSIICFTASQASIGKDIEFLKKLIQRLESDIFSFSILSIIDDITIEICRKCDGDGVELCKECGGDGHLDDVDCPICDGSGRAQCNNCGGLGEVDKIGFVDIRVDEYLSYNKQIFTYFEIKEEATLIEDDIIIDLLYEDPLTFNYSHYFSQTDYLGVEVTQGDYYFGELISNPTFNKFKSLIKTNLTVL